MSVTSYTNPARDGMMVVVNVFLGHGSGGST